MSGTFLNISWFVGWSKLAAGKWIGNKWIRKMPGHIPRKLWVNPRIATLYPTLVVSVVSNLQNIYLSWIWSLKGCLDWYYLGRRWEMKEVRLNWGFSQGRRKWENKPMNNMKLIFIWYDMLQYKRESISPYLYLYRLLIKLGNKLWNWMKPRNLS